MYNIEERNKTMKKIFTFIGDCFDGLFSSLDFQPDTEIQERFQKQCQALNIVKEDVAVPEREDYNDALYTDLSNFSNDMRKVVATHGRV